MSALIIPTEVLYATTSIHLEADRQRAKGWRSEDHSLNQESVTDAVLADLLTAAEEVKHTSFARVIGAIAAARKGEVKAIPSFVAAPEVLRAYLQAEMIDGWLYVREFDGRMWPWLVKSITIETPRGGYNDEPRIVIALTADHPIRSQKQETVTVSKTITLAKSDVTKKRPDAILLANHAVRETPELRADYQARLDRFEEVMRGGFRKQFLFSGNADVSRWESEELTGRKVVHDVAPRDLAALRGTAAGALSEDLLPVPVQTIARVFDLGSSATYNVNVGDLTDYRYDPTLRDKLILPPDQRELLDVLTSDTGSFTADLIAGKSAGNVILAKGIPGVGKTLTAEVYAELVERPLYSIHSGTLGVTAEEVRSRLETAFKVSKRLNLVLLLDEADVFVLERGDNLQANAICAEFLRTLEYFDGLLFMTTNRADDIDDAILSRCAALIDYRAPEADDARRIWGVLADANKVTIPEPVLADLLDGFQGITPRDIKMLLRLTVRMAESRGEDLTTELFARCAMFRGLHYRPEVAR